MNGRDAALMQAVQAIVAGSVLIFPTETLYALGCSALDRKAVDRVVTIKGREQDKPLPLIIGCMAQLQCVAQEITPEVLALAQSFWPGPLSIVLPARDELSPRLKDALGWTSVRLTPHPLARELCVRAGVPLVGTSANPAGKEPAARPQDLDPELVQAADFVLQGPLYPYGGPPSTVIKIVEHKKLHLFRSGAVSVRELQLKGWTVIERKE